MSKSSLYLYSKTIVSFLFHQFLTIHGTERFQAVFVLKCRFLRFLMVLSFHHFTSIGGKVPSFKISVSVSVGQRNVSRILDMKLLLRKAVFHELPKNQFMKRLVLQLFRNVSAKWKRTSANILLLFGYILMLQYGHDTYWSITKIFKVLSETWMNLEVVIFSKFLLLTNNPTVNSTFCEGMMWYCLVPYHDFESSLNFLRQTRSWFGYLLANGSVQNDCRP